MQVEADDGVDSRSALARISGFREVDELVRSQGAVGFVDVHAIPSVLDALSQHIERRAVSAGRAVVRVGGAADDAWRDLAARLGVAASSDPLAVAQGIFTRARRAVVVVFEPVPTRWGGAVAKELAALASSPDAPGQALFLVLSEAPPAYRARTIAVDPGASGEDVQLWWDAVARDAARQTPSRLDRIDALEGWWSAARSTPADARFAPPARSAAAQILLTRLALSQRSWPIAEAAGLGSGAALDELIALGAVESDASGRVACRAEAASPSAPPEAWSTFGAASSPEHAVRRGPRALRADFTTHAGLAPIAGAEAEARFVADRLEASAINDPWAAARASELYAIAGDADQAEAASMRALRAVTDAGARGDFWQRWESTLEVLPGGDAIPRLLRCADLALDVGDADRALGFAHAAAARGGESYESMLVLGRATTVRGDLTTAAIALGKALELAHVPAMRARAAVEIAEVRYIAGDLEDARKHAASALVDGADHETRLLARNVLGKLLLAGASWSDAEQHFAADACQAACSGDHVGELRARLNRAIALLSSGRYDEARAMLLAVLEDGERRTNLRAVAYALSNLATIATLRHDYPEALSLSVRAIDVLRRMGEKIMLARLITNLAELRLRIGLIAEAEQALIFGRQACNPGMPGAAVTSFALVAAGIHLARGRTAEANVELASAIAGAGRAGMGSKLGECYRLEARVALEDGDLVRAEHAIGKAQQEPTSSYDRAEIAVLSAMRARAAGEDFTDAALEALDLAREVADGEFAREAHLLLYLDAAARNDARAAVTHLDAAVSFRNQVADALPEELRRRFLGRRDLAELARIEVEMVRAREASLRDPGADSASAVAFRLCPQTSGAPRSDGSRVAAAGLRPIVGDDPAMLVLANAIRKVGQSDATVLVCGESGTGKELVAEAIHAASTRRAGPMVKVNCSALVETLLLSELFGHEKGSFTGAAARRRGRFELAEGGTIFLDEIGDISPRTQVALLRVLQDRSYERVGGVTPLRANVRIICATHRDLRAMVARGEFREDLFYRLRGLVLEVPALRQRIGDVAPIAAAILAGIAAERGAPVKTLSARALEGLGRHTWPGNVRELENALRAAALFSEGDTIELEDFTSNVDGLRGLELCSRTLRPEDVAEVSSGTRNASGGPVSAGALIRERSAGLESQRQPSSSAELYRGEDDQDREPGSTPTDVAYAHIRGGVSLFDMKRQLERDCIERALGESQGNITRAAALLGMKRPRLSQLVKQYGLGSGSEES